MLELSLDLGMNICLQDFDTWEIIFFYSKHKSFVFLFFEQWTFPDSGSGQFKIGLILSQTLTFLAEPTVVDQNIIF